MLSDLLDALGLALIIAGVFVLLGLGPCLLAGGAAVMFIAQGLDDAAASSALAALSRRVRASATAPGRAFQRRKAARISARAA